MLVGYCCRIFAPVPHLVRYNSKDNDPVCCQYHLEVNVYKT